MSTKDDIHNEETLQEEFHTIEVLYGQEKSYTIDDSRIREVNKKTVMEIQLTTKLGSQWFTVPCQESLLSVYGREGEAVVSMNDTTRPEGHKSQSQEEGQALPVAGEGISPEELSATSFGSPTEVAIARFNREQPDGELTYETKSRLDSLYSPAYDQWVKAGYVVADVVAGVEKTTPAVSSP
ncbi:hypothetical protein TREMEDRAFT_61334 [Tremella mesenterica DSM 1558]|uniref:uncharacterized protein n=1 Tax=Tremella mesenterica (strain ATCC 24925 / CBS 8224 / DSM 1558 / NBRC 9311 / NRRL Y-6157 / RJB 2259-6 / UBC 559-6) TaxID=578456 RepID=UPI0003F49754|nr:uncharacterized protein TREMEDRAFT_61334 [Tremella mesenterica DSM 1558]EIW70828.1 hypothetical protein TREMEDRAFT_61334 [Tremella mesenterica DSM 1558]